MKKDVVLYPRERKMMMDVAEQIKLARKRRKLSSALVAEKAKISRQTLWKVEKGDPSVSIGAYLSVLFALRLEKDILYIGKDDEYGRMLQDEELLYRDKR